MFKTNYFPTLIYLGIIITLLLLTFNFMDILQKSSKATGYAISEKSNENVFKNISINSFIKEKLSNPESPYYMYNALIILLFTMISIILIRFIYKIQI